MLDIHYDGLQLCSCVGGYLCFWLFFSFNDSLDLDSPAQFVPIFYILPLHPHQVWTQTGLALFIDGSISWKT